MRLRRQNRSVSATTFLDAELPATCRKFSSERQYWYSLFMSLSLVDNTGKMQRIRHLAGFILRDALTEQSCE